MISVNISGALGFLSEDELRKVDTQKAIDEFNTLDDTGWVSLPADYCADISKEINDIARKIRNESDVFIVIGIGGSYLGARAAIEYVNSPFFNALRHDGTPEIYFTGNNASAEYLQHIITLIGDRDFSVNVISKSGSTIETSIAMRFFKSMLETKYGGEGLHNRLYVTTDKTGSPLREMAAREGYTCLEMPAHVGGRYSVQTAVGLLPCAVAGLDIDEMMSGAHEELKTGLNDACLYASARQILYSKGKKIEMLACFEPAFRCTGEWWKQLFGESEGKEGIGIFPAYVDYTADLHSLGQYIQEGERTLMETFVTFDSPRIDLAIPGGPIHDDKIASLAGLNLHKVNQSASEAVKQAHIGGGVPVIEITAPKMSAGSFGALTYFFMRSCAISALISGVVPFGQPGVEAYKNNLFTILGLTK